MSSRLLSPVKPDSLSKSCDRSSDRSEEIVNEQSHSTLPPGSIWPFALLSCCFLWWAIANNLTDPMVKIFWVSFGLIMVIVGGTIITPLQGLLVDHLDVYLSYWVPWGCFVVIGAYARFGRKYEQV